MGLVIPGGGTRLVPQHGCTVHRFVTTHERDESRLGIPVLPLQYLALVRIRHGLSRESGKSTETSYFFIK